MRLTSNRNDQFGKPVWERLVDFQFAEISTIQAGVCKFNFSPFAKQHFRRKVGYCPDIISSNRFASFTFDELMAYLELLGYRYFFKVSDKDDVEYFLDENADDDPENDYIIISAIFDRRATVACRTATTMVLYGLEHDIEKI
jgi:hypothetical protein